MDNQSVLKDNYARRIDYLRLSVTDRCNLRCTYCMPPQGVPHLRHDDILTYEEIVRVVKITAAAGIRKVRFTGGEPLVRKDFPSLVSQIAQSNHELDLSLTTNGVLLADYASELKRAGLHRVNISIDSLIEETYRALTRGGDLAKPLEGMKVALDVGLHPVKINVVLLKGVNHTLKQIKPFVELIHRYPVHVRFIEYMSSRGALDESSFVPIEVVRKSLSRLGRFRESAAPVGAGPARYLEMAGAPGKIGLISPISAHFCPSCNRLRLTAEGKMKPCLLSSVETDLKELLRQGASDEDILHAVKYCLGTKPRGYRESQSILPHRMSRIGG